MSRPFGDVFHNHEVAADCTPIGIFNYRKGWFRFAIAKERKPPDMRFNMLNSMAFVI